MQLRGEVAERRVATLMLVGAAIRVTLSLWAATFIGALLFGVEARDPMTPLFSPLRLMPGKAVQEATLGC